MRYEVRFADGVSAGISFEHPAYAEDWCDDEEEAGTCDCDSCLPYQIIEVVEDDD